MSSDDDFIRSLTESNSVWFIALLAALGNVQERAQVSSAISTLDCSRIIANELTNQRGTRGRTPDGWMEPADYLRELSNKHLQRVIRSQMFDFMHQHMPKVVSAPFKQEPWKNDDRLMQLATKRPLRFVTDQQGRQHFGLELGFAHSEDFARFLGPY
jgi:hypothetical protein